MTTPTTGSRPIDVAREILFAHPSLQALGEVAKQRVDEAVDATDLDELATTISRQGPASKNGGWATIEAVGRIAGERAESFRISADTLAAAVSPLADAIRRTQNDPKLEGLLWFVPPARAGGYRPSRPRSGFDWTITGLEPTYGVVVASVSAGCETRRWELSLGNYTPSFRGLSVAFLDAHGVPIAPAGWRSRLPAAVSGRFETATHKWLALLPPAMAIEGVTVPDKPVSVRFEAPPGARRMRLVIGGLGRDAWDPAADALGAGVSAVLGYAVPAILRDSGVDSPAIVYRDLLARNDLVEEAMLASDFLLDAPDALAAYAALVERLGPMIYGDALPELTRALLDHASAGALAKAARVVSWAAASLAATNGPAGRFAGDPLSAPSTFSQTLFPEMVGGASVLVAADPVHGTFPAAARKVEVKATFAGRSHDESVTVAGLATREASSAFAAVPANRRVDFSVAVLDGTNRLLATAAGSSPAGYGAREATRVALREKEIDFDDGTRFTFAATLSVSASSSDPGTEPSLA